ncbi:MAG: NTP transferase domain-containing protein [Acinetobacter sp.]
MTDLVILAGGQARRMNGINKLLQTFDQQMQLLKINQHFGGQVAQKLINSHRDQVLYQRLVPEIQCFQDDETGFLGPLMGMKSAWQYVQHDYVLFVPCDVTYLPPYVLRTLHHTLARHPQAHVAYVEMNGDALYPFCLMKRSALPVLQQHLSAQQFSLRKCFQQLHAQKQKFQHRSLIFHSINSFDELQQYQQMNLLSQPKYTLAQSTGEV